MSNMTSLSDIYSLIRLTSLLYKLVQQTRFAGASISNHQKFKQEI